jgi:hypothetical protein
MACDYKIATYNYETGERLIALDIQELGDSTNTHNGYHILIRCDVTDLMYLLEDDYGLGVPVEDTLFLDTGYVSLEGRARLTFYNDRAFIRIWIMRDRNGYLSYAIQRGSYYHLYKWHRKELGNRHGSNFSDFNTIIRTSQIPFDLYKDDEDGALEMFGHTPSM